MPGPYDLVVIGGGTAGLVSAFGAAGLGARVAIIERHLLGGDCLNVGCVPSKALIRSARAVGEIARAPALGVSAGPVSVDFPAIMARMRARRATIAVNDSEARLRKHGIEVFLGEASFVDGESLRVDGQALRFRRAVIAAGGRPSSVPIDGIDRVQYLTNETVFDLTALPPRLAIVGGGPIGCELAQVFARFGSRVTVLQKDARIMPRDDADAAAIVAAALARDGVAIETAATITGVEPHGACGARVTYTREGQRHTLTADALLVAAGRSPNVESLNLAAAGIDYTRDGVTVNDRLQTTNPRVFAAGDVCSRYKFTHAADALARIVLQNALFYGRRKASALVIPWSTYTDPEVAHVGVTQDEVAKSDGRLATIAVPLHDVDRAIVDDDTEGFVKVHHEKGAIRGCTIVAPHAGETIGEAVYAMTQAGTLASLSATIHPYPTVAEALRKAGDAYRRQSLTPAVRRWFERYFAWTR